MSVPSSRKDKVDFKVYLITDRNQALDRPLEEVVGRAVGAGIKAVQLREKDLPGRDLFFLAESLRKVTEGARLLINDRSDIAAAVGADGVHLTQNSISPGYARKLLGPDSLIGQSTHSVEEARIAQEEGADFITLGPVFPTPSKLKYGPPLGPEAIVAVREKVEIPVLAIGGIKPNNIKEVLEAGADGVALISAIMSAEDIEGAVFSLLRESAAGV